MSQFNLGDVVAAIGMAYTFIVGYVLVLPALDRPAQRYFVFLLAWGVSYSIGYVCDVVNAGPEWLQWRVVDISYEQWSTTLGITAYIAAMKLFKRSYDQRSLFVAAGISLVVFTILTYVWEVGQGYVSGQGVDWKDCGCFAIGALITIAPFPFLRPRVARRVQFS